MSVLGCALIVLSLLPAVEVRAGEDLWDPALGHGAGIRGNAAEKVDRHRLYGSRMVSKGRLDLAVVAYSRALETVLDEYKYDSFTYWRLQGALNDGIPPEEGHGKVLMFAGNWERVKPVYERAWSIRRYRAELTVKLTRSLPSLSSDDRKILDQALERVRAGNWKKAIKLYRELRDREPGWMPVHLLLASAYFQNGNTNEFDLSLDQFRFMMRELGLGDRYRELMFEAARMQESRSGRMAEGFKILQELGLMTREPDAALNELAAAQGGTLDELKQALESAQERLGFAYWWDARRLAAPYINVKVVTVGTGGEYSRIHDAVEVVKDQGGVVRLLPGTYRESLSVVGVRSLVITGAGPDSVFIEGTLHFADVKGLVLNGLSIDAADGASAVVLERVEGATIKNCEISGAAETGLWAIDSLDILLWKTALGYNMENIIEQGTTKLALQDIEIWGLDHDPVKEH